MTTNGDGRSDPERQKTVGEILACLPSLKAFAISLCHDVTRAEDLVQETVSRALANLHRFEPGTNMPAWLFTILRNQFHTEYRKLKREEPLKADFAKTLSLSRGLSKGEAETEAEAVYDFRRLLLYLACLPAYQSDALVAVGYLGMSYEESAERLGCAVGTVKSRVNRARLELATLIEESTLKHVDLTRLKTTTRGVPQSHPYYPIAKAYEEMYAASEGVSDGSSGGQVSADTVSEKEKLWENLVASGALDENQKNLDELMRSDQDDP